MILLTVLSCLLALAFLGALAYFVRRIITALESIGTGGKSSLEMVTWGVRAIESETAHIAPQVTQLNANLAQVAEGLKVIEGDLVGTATAAIAQKRYA
ncbi:MAG: hypothetical protein NVSMB17_06620 [Candidatus Dormibacteria bacterium]